MTRKIDVAIVGLGFGAELISALAAASGRRDVRHLPAQPTKAERGG